MNHWLVVSLLGALIFCGLIACLIIDAWSTLRRIRPGWRLEPKE